MNNKNNKKKGGIVNSISTLLYSLVFVGVVLAGGEAMGITDIGSAINVAKDKALYLAECVPSMSCDFSVDLDAPVIDNSSGGDSQSNHVNNGDYVGPEGGEPYVLKSGLIEVSEAEKMLNELKVEEPKSVDYDRKEWKHWSNFKGRSCWNVRKEVLARDAVPGSLKLVDKNKKPTDDIKNACAIGTPENKDGKIKINPENAGVWYDPYSGDKITNPSKIDIDHIIPLHRAAQHGGQEWSNEKKQQYANDYDVLIATSARENRIKGDKGPGEYMPPLKPYRCSYSKMYIDIAHKYDLSISKADKAVLTKSLANDCK